MLAEIFIIRLEALLRSAAPTTTTTASDTRFVPIALPRASKPNQATK
ncbi:MAG TPA: hypothetical protein VLX44_17055 [Xanthobacteraceae bacterium]|nr:hypothetical protein [Xanthobacteraceae bacterium]